MAAKAKSSKRELIDTGKDQRYVRRHEEGQFDGSIMSADRSARTFDRKPRRKFRPVREIEAIRIRSGSRLLPSRSNPEVFF